ncbi:cobaltochelatase CobN [Pseudomonas citronellolis]|uniref:cobaltochelatase subunit CobN n=1 Tax=Pseudomonas citronellolis TaxID=53408 RepID=UPI0020A00090|nr:cobaltochelatase subunit CobN [Pseudomonas citronellolis]MCP1642867.1 cobaltochelatase CobN [Pseudomonas citronellolis]MCP1666001.1 cobaltochelatase CobN [Pseudomonas citronellolis]MCP1696910.1 cobaltochelatase CobN [Pseudomonas citronellolis]MCP1703348.1 cobaltochelatase CobN [Pseudomonas citronellolis]MCP1797482.1 cobaltochelatase CobN [Pseudomonas citronellolis]
MHLLRTQPGGFVPDDGIAHLAQTPAELVILCSGDSHLALLAEAARELPADYPSLRLANPMQLQNHASVDLYVDEVLRHAKVILISVHGGVGYWRYGIEQLVALAERGATLILVPGDDKPDPELTALCSVAPGEAERLWQYLRQGGLDNARQFLANLASQYLDRAYPWNEPRALPRVALHHPGHAAAELGHWQAEWNPGWPVAALLFYRTHLQAANTGFIDTFCASLRAQQLNPLPIAVASLKEAACLEQVEALLDEACAELIINTTGFAQSNPDAPQARPFRRDVPVLQAICSLDNLELWRANAQGLGPRDLAMHVALPELDGRLITRPISFKGLAWRSERSQSDVVCYLAHRPGMDFVAELARRWVLLARKANADKRVALILANYPTRDGRIGNGVGLDTPAAALNILRAMEASGYPVAGLPETGDALIHSLLGGVSNDLDNLDLRPCAQSLALADYLACFARLPEANQRAVRERWGEPEQDPMCRNGRMMVAGLRLGLAFVGIQPARGYQLDPAAIYHDPALVPPHGYLAFYFWLREAFGADALIHVGKHGNLEWLPGKGVGLSEECWPDAILGPLPNLYPFIVNDPGEGAQAKRRSQALIIDHLMPPLTRAENYGPLRDLERLADEYYDASLLDPRRAVQLRGEILDAVRAAALDRELGLQLNDDEDSWLPQLDAYLCDLKESQIRDGLHVFGESPAGQLRRDTLLSLVRIPRGDGRGGNASLLRALAADLQLGRDPLDSNFAEPWDGPRPEVLQQVSDEPWRSNGDTRERLELLALQLIEQDLDGPGAASALVLRQLRENVAPLLDACGANEIGQLLAGLNGRFVPAGPSGAPSRGRLDVLPTGRNFFTVDVRNLPTPTAYRLGFQSASRLLERHLQDHGDHLRQLGLSVWGTATMRSGGDDIAQALALLGVRPVWQAGSQRVEDFEILPLSLLDRPRVDVTLRVSGFFRDAFANLIRLFDAAVQAVAALDEPEDMNPLAARVRAESTQLQASGVTEEEARRQAGWRIFGAQPGTYGAGVQGVIEERSWESRSDLAAAYLNWGGYAYGAGDDGTPARERFAQRLDGLQAVLHNQDNREHDILDSNDYYQFQGGMLAAAEVIQDRRVASYHGDHSQPDNPRIRTLKEELGRVLRARAVNPKWIAGMKRHGYKGAFEMAATVDYLFAFDATSELVEDHQYQLLADAYLLDDDTREFIQRHNPEALRDMAERLLEAQQRGLWQEPGEYREALENILVDSEES